MPESSSESVLDINLNGLNLNSLNQFNPTLT